MKHEVLEGGKAGKEAVQGEMPHRAGLIGHSQTIFWRVDLLGDR